MSKVTNFNRNNKPNPVKNTVNDVDAKIDSLEKEIQKLSEDATKEIALLTQQIKQTNDRKKVYELEVSRRLAYLSGRLEVYKELRGDNNPPAEPAPTVEGDDHPHELPT